MDCSTAVGQPSGSEGYMIQLVGQVRTISAQLMCPGTPIRISQRLLGVARENLVVI
jgi:hypothetical protein